MSHTNQARISELKSLIAAYADWDDMENYTWLGVELNKLERSEVSLQGCARVLDCNLELNDGSIPCNAA
jgi:hypothetical protein